MSKRRSRPLSYISLIGHLFISLSGDPNGVMMALFGLPLAVKRTGYANATVQSLIEQGAASTEPDDR